MEAIFFGLFRYRQVFKELQIKAILIRSDSSTAVQDFGKQKKAGAFSRLSIQGDYSIKKEIFKNLCLAKQIAPTLDLFATGENKLVDRIVAKGEDEKEANQLNAFSRPWKEVIFWIHSLILKI
ncbi:MAG: hypothetical protein EZS28_001690 [Streblomastix strix]|uniref:Uncharacterized protein n=1 Tax=Streblomastix strix TaxID=222440 RepID=A0A5J4X6F1_9EUKA|nr:MAG: hypothetical protein EZS28_001690 [Streblomastix strix]